MVTKQSERLRSSGDGMRKAILVFVTVAVVAAAQPAGAIDNGFRGTYRLRQRELPGSTCFPHFERRRVEVGFVNERIRTIDPVHSTQGARWRLRYARGHRFPWQTDDRRFVLRYRRRTDTAVGILDGRLQTDCKWHVRLVIPPEKG